jgi:Ca2+-binding EF-hand superfamily protein
MFGGDKVMTRAEVTDHVGKLFAKLDANRDGFITRQEVDAMHARMQTAMVKVGDAQKRVGDIEKRLAERGIMIGDRGAMFDRLDTNHDGNISRQEFMAHKPEIRRERVMVMRDGPDGAPRAMPPMDGHPGMEMHMRHMGGMRMGMGGFGGHLFEMADGNHDGRVSLAEAQAAALAHFDKADLNHDGKITPDERGQMRRVIRLERRQS